MQLETSAGRIGALKAARFAPVDYPESWQSATSWPADSAMTLASPAVIDGCSTFENRPMQLRFLPQAGDVPVLSWGAHRWPLLPEHAGRGVHNMQLGEICVIEHLLALMVALNLRLDAELTEPSFPTFDDCNATLARAVMPVVQPAGALRYLTVAHPVAMVFERGYVILEPDDGRRVLTIDHQVSYPGQSIGDQRIAFDLTPARFLWFCSARTTNFGRGPDARRYYDMAAAGATAPYPFTTRNVVFCDEKQFFNPLPQFDASGHNLEFILHEVMDVIAFLKFIEVAHGGNDGKFVGRLTTFYFDHHRQVDALQALCGAEGVFTAI